MVVQHSHESPCSLLLNCSLNKAGYRIVLDEDPGVAAVFAVHDGKFSHPKSYAFMPEHTNL